tara:strand:- start:928 stop:1149 length:222 start_codon:yes stop_codon:yes gene_type:complete
MVAVSVILQLVLPMILTMEPLSGIVSNLPLFGAGAADVLASHKTNQAGGAFVIAVITIAAAFLAPTICGAVNI